MTFNVLVDQEQDPSMAETAKAKSSTPCITAARLQPHNLPRKSQRCKSSRANNIIPLRQSFKDMKSNSVTISKPIMASPSNTLPPCPLDKIDPAFWASFSRVSTRPDDDMLSLSYDEIVEQRFSFDEEDLLRIEEDKTHTDHIRHEMAKGIKRAVTMSSNKIRITSVALRMPSPAFLKKSLRGGVDRNSQETPPSSSHDGIEPKLGTKFPSTGTTDNANVTGLDDQLEHQATTIPHIGETEASVIYDGAEIAAMIREDLRIMREESHNMSRSQLRMPSSRAIQYANAPRHDLPPAWRIHRMNSETDMAQPQSVRPPSSSSSMLNIYARAFGRPPSASSSLNSYHIVHRDLVSRHSDTMPSDVSKPDTANASSSSSTVQPFTQPFVLSCLDHINMQQHRRAMSADSRTLVSRPMSSGTYGSYAGMIRPRRGRTERIGIDHRRYTPSHLARSAHRPQSAPAIAQRALPLSQVFPDYTLTHTDLKTFLELNKSITRSSDESRKAQTSSRDIWTRDITVFEPAGEHIKIPRRSRIIAKIEKWAARIGRILPGAVGQIPELRKRKSRRFCLRMNEKLDVHAQNLQLAIYH